MLDSVQALICEGEICEGEDDACVCVGGKGEDLPLCVWETRESRETNDVCRDER